MINHDEVNKRFSCRIDDKECSVDYDIKESAPRSIDIYRTFVHPDLRGKGVAESLLAAISEYAAKQGLKVLPSCSYAVLYYRRHRLYASIVADGVDLNNSGSCRIK